MGFFDIIKAFLPLLVIVGLLYGALILVRKYGINTKGKNNPLIDIKVLGTKMIMPKRFISVVKVEDKLLVLGVSEHSVNLLKEMDSKELAAAELYEEPKENFLALFKKNIGFK